MATGSIGVTSLEAAAHEQVVKNLGELAESITSRFSCGGVLGSSSKIQLFFRQGSGQLAGVVFPGADKAAIQQLFSACSVASFGMGSKQVTDKSYRDAVKLEPDQFATSFQLCDTPILGEIQMLMVPDVHTIQAKLYKLNIYALGGHFKAHVDTPRSEKMFGSLVVCLPTQFSGGALVTRHNGREVQFDWSSSTQSPLQSVCWASFFSDVEHEVLPVTEGYRITLTYNLYSNTQQDMLGTVHTVDLTSSPFCSELHSAVSNAHFMRDGGVLGFGCHYTYVFKDLNEAKNLPCILKGADRIVFVTAKSLGLPVVVKPVGKDGDAKFVLPEFTKFDCGVRYYEDDEESPVEETFKEILGLSTICCATKITWCQPLTQWLPAAAYAAYAYSNDISCEAIYEAAAILVGVPKWGERQIEASEMGRKRKSQESASADKAVKQCKVEEDKSSNHDQRVIENLLS